MKEPKLLIEEHYQISPLIERQERHVEERERNKRRLEEKEETFKIIKDAPNQTMTEFWCKTCKKDYLAICRKQVDAWSNLTAFYKTKHSCGNWGIRFITDRNKDPYWFKSKKVKRDQVDNYQAVIQPWQTGFNMLYGKK